MENVTYICPGCGEDLEYDEAMNQHLCKYCREYYDFAQLVNYRKEDESQNETEIVEDTHKTMKVRMYICRKCKVEMLTLNEAETATCPYCGSKDLVFIEEAEEVMPDQIIPFAKTKEEALEYMKKVFRKAAFIGDGLKNMQVDAIQATFIPYWSFEVSLDLTMRKRTQYVEDSERQIYEGSEHLSEKIMIDASRRFFDGIANALEPYDLWDSVSFEASFLKDALAEKLDETEEQKKERALRRAKLILRNRLYKRDGGGTYDKKTYGHKAIAIEEDVALDDSSMIFKGKIKEATYYYLPVYFVTATINGKKILTLINGQTGRVVGTVPVNNKAYITQKILYSLFWMIFMVAIGGSLGSLSPLFSLIMLIFSFAILHTTKTKESGLKTSESTMKNFARRGGR